MASEGWIHLRTRGRCRGWGSFAASYAGSRPSTFRPPNPFGTSANKHISKWIQSFSIQSRILLSWCASLIPNRQIWLFLDRYRSSFTTVNNTIIQANMADSFHRIRASVIEGRSRTPRYIQTQLVRLHEALQKSQSSIRQAIEQDNGYSSAEVDTEIYVTFHALRQEYESFDFPKFLEDEYSTARLKDSPSRRVPVGCVYIIPSSHTRFYSIVQPVAAAIATGNCVMIQVSLSEPFVFLNKRFCICLLREILLTASARAIGITT